MQEEWERGRPGGGGDALLTRCPVISVDDHVRLGCGMPQCCLHPVLCCWSEGHGALWNRASFAVRLVGIRTFGHPDTPINIRRHDKDSSLTVAGHSVPFHQLLLGQVNGDGTGHYPGLASGDDSATCFLHACNSSPMSRCPVCALGWWQKSTIGNHQHSLGHLSSATEGKCLKTPTKGDEKK